MAFFRVSADIHGNDARSSFITARRLSAISRALAFAAGGKYLSAYFRPTGSPRRVSVRSAQRGERGGISVPWNAKVASANGLASHGDAALITCHRRYAFQVATGVLLSSWSTCWRNFGSATLR